MTVVYELKLDDAWQVAQYSPAETEPDTGRQPDLTGLEWLEARVPGAVHYDLIHDGRLGNPYASTEAAFAAAWVARADWIYRTTFAAPSHFDAAVGHDLVFQCDGIDTYADVWVNDTLIGSTANAYRSYRLPVPAEALRPGSNAVLVHVKGHHRMVEPRLAEAKARLGHPEGVEGLLGKSLIRRYQRSFFTNSSLLNLGTGVLGIGVNQSVRLYSPPGAEVRGTHVVLGEFDQDNAEVRVEVVLERHRLRDTGLTVQVKLADDLSDSVVTGSVTTAGDTGQVDLRVPRPRLWWPRGYGDPHLYRLTVVVRDGEEVLDTHTVDVGLRQVELVSQDENGRPTFQFKINGRPVHVRGSNLIPVDYIKVHGAWDEYERLLRLVENGNQNMIRMWGGGAVEADAFYDYCDAHGIMVWQDGYLHSNTYPDYDEAWVEEFRAESTELIARIRRHPCLTLLCGGNEQREGWDEWYWKDTLDRFYGEKLVTEVVPGICRELAPELPYIDNSPHGGLWSQSPAVGESHTWGNFFNAHKDPTFVTETCWGQESYSRPETLREVMGLDVDELAGPGWTERWSELTSLPLITKFPYTSYHNTGGLRGYLRGLEIEQAYADYYAMSVFRLRSPSCRGTLYWSLNKGGPLFQFGAVDYGGRPMMSYYVLSRLNADLVVGAYRDGDDVRVVASNESTVPVEAEVRTLHLRTDGAVLSERTTPVELPPGLVTRVPDLVGLYREVTDRTREVVHVQLLVDGRILSEDMLFFVPVAEVEVPDGTLSVRVAKDEGSGDWWLDVSTTGVAKMVQIDCGERLMFSDDYFPLVPGSTKRVRVTALEPGTGKPTLKVSCLDAEAEQTFVLP